LRNGCTILIHFLKRELSLLVAESKLKNIASLLLRRKINYEHPANPTLSSSAKNFVYGSAPSYLSEGKKAAGDLVQGFQNSSILQELTGQSRNRIFVFNAYLDLFNE
jgi:hypothetical protein